MAAAADKRGLKRICTNCGTRFYDFAKRPIVCPSCETEFTIDMKVKTRRSRVAPVETEGQVSEAAAKKAEAEKADEDEIEEDGDLVSLDEAAELEDNGDDDEDDTDIDLDDDLDDIDVEGDDDDDDLDLDVDDEED